MSNLRNYDAKRCSEHHASVATGGGRTWVTCRCGWVSRRHDDGFEASAEWAEHVASFVKGDLHDS